MPPAVHEHRFAWRGAQGASGPRSVAAAGGWLGEGDRRRTARIFEALASVGLDDRARTSQRLAGILCSTPSPPSSPSRSASACIRTASPEPTDFGCESAEVVLDQFHGPIADKLDLGDTAAFDALVEATASEWRRARWLLEASFELPADPAAGARAKLSSRPTGLAASNLDAHRAILRLASELGLQAAPYGRSSGRFVPRACHRIGRPRWRRA